MIGYPKKNRENCPKKCFWWKEKETRLKFNPGLALIGLRTTGPWAFLTHVFKNSARHIHTCISQGQQKRLSISLHAWLMCPRALDKPFCQYGRLYVCFQFNFLSLEWLAMENDRTRRRKSTQATFFQTFRCSVSTLLIFLLCFSQTWEL